MQELRCLMTIWAVEKDITYYTILKWDDKQGQEMGGTEGMGGKRRWRAKTGEGEREEQMGWGKLGLCFYGINN